MKKNSVMTALLMMALMIGGPVTMTSCGDDVPEADGIDRCEVVVTYEYSQEFLTYYDVTYTVKEFVGAPRQVKVAEHGKKAFQFYCTNPQGEAHLSIDCTPKADAEKAVADSTYKMLRKMDSRIRLVEKNGKVVAFRDFGPGEMVQSVRGSVLTKNPDMLDYHTEYALKYDMDKRHIEAENVKK